jgi:hypothetical protein
MTFILLFVLIYVIFCSIDYQPQEEEDDDTNTVCSSSTIDIH